MESWSYVSGRKEPVSNETISSSDGFARSKNIIGGYDLKAPFGNFDNNIVVSGQQAIDRQAFGELGYQELIGKQSTDNSVSIDLFTPNPNSFSLENESNSMHSSSVADCNVKGSSFIDLKLGRFGDLRDTQYHSRISKGTTILSSSDSSTPAKRSRVGVNSLIAYCQVYGCNKDLSSSKEYHKRHKVCEVHSKTAKVIVNGIEQRFCQQCSRFHLLAEFDDGKRSCRKRLAGHNERRRKPHVGILSGRSGKMLHSFNGFSGGSFPGTPFSTSFICQDILPNNLLYPSKYRTNDWFRHVKVEDTNDIGPLSAIPVSRSTFGESTIRYPLDLGGSNSSSCTFLQDTSLGNRDFSMLDAAPTIQQFSGITDSSGSALSLLSSQSRNSMSHSAGIPMARSHVVPGRNTYYGMSPVSNKHVGVGSRTFTSVVPNRFSSSEMSSTEETQLGPVMMPHSEATNFDITVGAYQRAHWLSAKHGLSCEDGSTIDLLQLSSQLQRVERQKQSMPVMQENDSYSFFRSRFT